MEQVELETRGELVTLVHTENGRWDRVDGEVVISGGNRSVWC